MQKEFEIYEKFRDEIFKIACKNIDHIDLKKYSDGIKDEGYWQDNDKVVYFEQFNGHTSRDVSSFKFWTAKIKDGEKLTEEIKEKDWHNFEDKLESVLYFNGEFYTGFIGENLKRNESGNLRRVSFYGSNADRTRKYT